MTKTMNLIQYIEQFRPDLNIPMSVERQRYLTYGFPGFRLTPEEQSAGYHWCACWDFMIIGPQHEEAEACTCVRMTPHSDIGYLYKLVDWIQDVKAGGLIDYDGYGNWATLTHTSSIDIIPSDVAERDEDFPFPKWVTHIMWYNR